MTDDGKRLNPMTHHELLPGVRVEEAGKEFRGRLKRGGVRDYDSRWACIERDGLRFRMRADDIPGAIAALEALWEAIIEDELRTPCCIYCGEELASVEDARDHHDERHEGRDRVDGGDGFEVYKYAADPNGTIQRLREERG